MDDQNTQNLQNVADAPIQNENSGTSQSAKQQIVEHVNGAKNVLVTVSSNPSVDELSAALGLTFMLGKLDKHATAVFSGKIPPAMEFLDPEKVFEDHVDSLRDFIIALDKEKADKLRYKVEDDVVKIFITPYQTVLKKEDFDFSQGDFNVDVVVALGVQSRDDLDKAITAHGRILHDATVVTVNSTTASSLGAVDWTDENASSIAEMLVSISESFGGGLLDEQISTAYLTGIVAATNRFSNEKTSPKVMTMAAQLMAAGANQQLIATNLRREGMITEEVRNKKDGESNADDGELSLDHGKKKPAQSSKPQKPTQQPKEKEIQAEIAEPAAPAPAKPLDKAQGKPAAAPAEQKPKSTVPSPQEEPSKELSEPQSQDSVAPAPAPAAAPQPETPVLSPSKPSQLDSQPPAIQKPKRREEVDKPQFGGTLNATTAGAEDDKREQAARDAQANTVSLSHVNPEGSQATQAQDAIEAARRAVEEVTEAGQQGGDGQPSIAITPPLQSEAPSPAPNTAAIHPVDTGVMDRQAGTAAPVAAPPAEPTPMESFMQPHANGVQPPEQQQAMPDLSVPPPVLQPDQLGATPIPAPVTSQQAGMPPLPPMPPGPQPAGGMPPLPPLPPMPGQPQDGAVPFQPQTSPDFMQSVNQSQNPWTEAAQDVAAKQAQQDATRQQKMDQMAQQYDQAVDTNRELQGKPPINNDHSTFPLPPTR